MADQNNKQILVIEDAAIAEAVKQGATNLGSEKAPIPITAFDLVMHRAPGGIYEAIKCNFAYPENIAVAGIKDSGEPTEVEGEVVVDDEFKPASLIYLINGQTLAAREAPDALRNQWSQARSTAEPLEATVLVTLFQGEANESKVWESIPINEEHIAYIAIARV